MFRSTNRDSQQCRRFSSEIGRFRTGRRITFQQPEKPTNKIKRFQNLRGIIRFEVRDLVRMQINFIPAIPLLQVEFFAQFRQTFGSPNSNGRSIQIE